jgi:endonuclease YncB( thermonuclease family)
MKQPPTGWTTPCTVVDVYDGDTVVVDVTRRLRVRLTGLWCDEIRGGTAETKAAGQAAKAALEDFLADAKAVVLHVPFEDDDFKDRLTMGRVLGKLFADGKDISVEMVEAGYGTAEKGETE